MEKCNFEVQERFHGNSLVGKNEFTDYWSTRQSINTPWFCMMNFRDHFRKIIRAFTLLIIAASNDPSYRSRVRF